VMGEAVAAGLAAATAEATAEPEEEEGAFVGTRAVYLVEDLELDWEAGDYSGVLQAAEGVETTEWSPSTKSPLRQQRPLLAKQSSQTGSSICKASKFWPESSPFLPVLLVEARPDAPSPGAQLGASCWHCLLHSGSIKNLWSHQNLL
jgi:hypothetical protein